MIDFIGDVHGHADKLKALLQKLGYIPSNGSFRHPEKRKALFVGDYIDRGPAIKDTLQIVRAMVDSGNAIALLGNHEYNALSFHYQNPNGGHLRPHLIKNVIPHYETLKQFQNQQAAYEEYLDWFKTLPLFYETDAFRAVHACWDAQSIAYLRARLRDDRISDELIHESATKESPLNLAVDITLKGKELRMPDGLSFTDKDGTIRNDIRIKWWENPASTTYRDISIENLPQLPAQLIDPSVLAPTHYYGEHEKPVFFGHYWLKGNPMLYRGNICCLDYSVAKLGYLVAYRFSGEVKLDAGSFVFV